MNWQLACLLVYAILHGGRAQEMISNQRCNSLADRGGCTNFAIKWHYDRFAHRCREFYYGGCEGNENRFDTKEACESECRFEDNSVFERCSQPYDAGSCRSDIPRHYFDMAQGKCVCTTWTGCGGNSNMFHSFDHCMNVCGRYAKPGAHEEEPNASRQPAPFIPTQNYQQIGQMTVHLPQMTNAHLQRSQMPSSHPIFSKKITIPGQQPAALSAGQTHIIRHSPDGTSKVIRTINSHPVHVAQRIMEHIRSGKAANVEEALVQMDSSGRLPVVQQGQANNLPNYVYLTDRQPLKPSYHNIPKVSMPADPEERRRWKQAMKKKIPPRRIYPDPINQALETVFEISTTPAPSQPPTNFYQETFDLEKMRRMKERARSPKVPVRISEQEKPTDIYKARKATVAPQTTTSTTTTTTTTTTQAPTTKRPIPLPVTREDFPPTPYTTTASVFNTDNTRIDLDDGKEDEDEEEYEEDEYEELEIKQHVLAPTTTTTTTTRTPPTRPPTRPPPPPTRPPPPPTRPPPPPTRPPTPSTRAQYPSPTRAMPKNPVDPGNSPLNLRPPNYSSRPNVPTTTTTARPPEPTTAAQRKSLWDNYESDEDEDDIDVSAADEDDM